MILVQLIIKSVLLVVLVLLMPNLYANDDEIVVIIPTRQFPDWERLRFTSLLPAPWGNQQVEIKEKNNKISFLSLRNRKFHLQFPVKSLKHIDNPHLRSSLLIYESKNIKKEVFFTLRIFYGQRNENIECSTGYDQYYKYVEIYLNILDFNKKSKGDMDFKTYDECGVPTNEFSS